MDFEICTDTNVCIENGTREDGNVRIMCMLDVFVDNNLQSDYEMVIMKMNVSEKMQTF